MTFNSNTFDLCLICVLWYMYIHLKDENVICKGACFWPILQTDRVFGINFTLFNSICYFVIRYLKFYEKNLLIRGQFYCKPYKILNRKLNDIIRAVPEQRSSPELRPTSKTEMHLKQKKVNSKSLEHEDVLYFNLQPYPMACTLVSVVMEWKQTLQGSYIWKMNAFWLTDMI